MTPILRKKMSGKPAKAAIAAVDPSPVEKQLAVEEPPPPVPPEDILAVLSRGRSASLVVFISRDQQGRRFLEIGIWSTRKPRPWRWQRLLAIRAAELAEVLRAYTVGAERIALELTQLLRHEAGGGE